MRSSSRKRGVSLVEVLISAIIIAAILLIVVGVLSATVEGSKLDSAGVDAAQNARRILQKLQRELVDAGGDEFGQDFLTSHPFAGPAASLPRVSFKRRLRNDVTTQADSEADNWGPAIEYRLADDLNEIPGDGLDNDRDGLVDERVLVRESEGRIEELARGVIGFVISRDPNANPDQIQMSITVGRGIGPDANGVPQALSRTLESIAVVRNRPH